ncbi:MAG: YceD family protein, partial [Candidatus Caldatribacteriaceae bacterium]
EIKYFCENDNYVDITKDLEELILVNLPMKPLCRPDCLGICPKCGANRNQGECGCEVDTTDPGLAVLKAWKSV